MIHHSIPSSSIWVSPDHPDVVHIVDQRPLPHEVKIVRLSTVEDAARAIQEMWVRGAPLIGVTAAYGMWFAVREALEAHDFDAHIQSSANRLLQTRPTAVNLAWAVNRQLETIRKAATKEEKLRQTFVTAQSIEEEDVEICRMIGVHGLKLIKEIAARKGEDTVNILTHCNAGRMACVRWGTATSPIYQAHEAGIRIHVWVDETRPRNQGARITAWELGQAGVPHTVIPDNTGGHLMQHGMVDICIVGTDRTSRTGDVANKIGTYLKALAAKDNDIPFYVALPSSTIDWEITDGLSEIPIETRDASEVSHIHGYDSDREKITKVRLIPSESQAVNYGFDVTPARLITGLITENGICEASETGISALFPER